MSDCAPERLMVSRAMGPRLGYALGTSGISLGSTPITLFLLFYLTEVMGLEASLAGLAVALPKIWDAIVDPMFGGWVDRTAIRMGRRGPIVAWSSIAFIASLLLTFALPHLESHLKLTLLISVIQIISSTSQTAFNVSQYALASEMTTNSRELGGLLSLAGVISQVFTVAAVAGAPLVVDWAGGAAAGYWRMAVVFAVVATILLAVFLFTTRQIPVVGQTSGAASLSLWASIRATLENRPYYLLIAFLMFQGVGTSMVFGFLPFANQYVLRGDARGLSLLEVVLFLAVMAGMPLTPILLRSMSTIRAMRVCNMGIAAALLMTFAASFGPLWCTWIALAATGVVCGAVGILLQTSILEVAQTKLRGSVVVATGFYLGIMVAATKLGNSAGGFVSGGFLQAIGFVSGGAHQSAATLALLRVGYTLAPMLLVIIAGVFLRFVVLPNHPREQP